MNRNKIKIAIIKPQKATFFTLKVKKKNLNVQGLLHFYICIISFIFVDRKVY